VLRQRRSVKRETADEYKRGLQQQQLLLLTPNSRASLNRTTMTLASRQSSIATTIK